MKLTLGKNHFVVTSNDLVVRIDRPLFSLMVCTSDFVMIFAISSEFFFSIATRYVLLAHGNCRLRIK